MRTKKIADIVFGGKRLKTFAPRLKIREGCPLSPILLNIMLEQQIRKEETHRLHERLCKKSQAIYFLKSPRIDKWS